MIDRGSRAPAGLRMFPRVSSDAAGAGDSDRKHPAVVPSQRLVSGGEAEAVGKGVKIVSLLGVGLGWRSAGGSWKRDFRRAPGCLLLALAGPPGLSRAGHRQAFDDNAHGEVQGIPSANRCRRRTAIGFYRKL